MPRYRAARPWPTRYGRPRSGRCTPGSRGDSASSHCHPDGLCIGRRPISCSISRVPHLFPKASPATGSAPRHAATARHRAGCTICNTCQNQLAQESATTAPIGATASVTHSLALVTPPLTDSLVHHFWDQAPWVDRERSSANTLRRLQRVVRIPRSPSPTTRIVFRDDRDRQIGIRSVPITSDQMIPANEL